MTEHKLNIELLDQIGRAEVSPFLITRIKQRIRQDIEHVPTKWVVTLSAGLVLLFILNWQAIQQRKGVITQSQNIESFYPNNSLYGE